MILTIDEIKKKIAPICKKYGVKKAFLFGSYARDEATENSDIDIRIIKGDVKGLIALSGLRLELAAAVGKEIDLISVMPSKKNILFVDLRKNIQADEILIFENC
jgi:hypothetical protein